ncbi:MAG: 50S ribosomal protein L23 [Rickettsiales bacterium]
MRKAKKKVEAKEVRACHYDTVLSPVITEKSTHVSEYNKVMFNVRLNASKSDIKESVEALFGVKVVKVNTLRRLGKTKLFRGTKGKQSDSKKAVITLAEGSSINLEGGVN